MPRTEAERAARRQFGNLLSLRESSRDVKSVAWLESLIQDFRFGLRMLKKYRTASLAAILSLALAIGACTGAFALIDALILRPLPLPRPNQLIALGVVMPSFFSPDNQPHESESFSYPEFQLLRDAARSDADLFPVCLSAGLQPVQFDDANGESDNVRAEAISGNGFDILGVKPTLGRLIQPADDSPAATHPVAVVSYSFWKRRFAASPSAIGRWVTVSHPRRQFQIVGVTAPSFHGLRPGYSTDVWLPLWTRSMPGS